MHSPDATQKTDKPSAGRTLLALAAALVAFETCCYLVCGAGVLAGAAAKMLIEQGADVFLLAAGEVLTRRGAGFPSAMVFGVVALGSTTLSLGGAACIVAVASSHRGSVRSLAALAAVCGAASGAAVFVSAAVPMAVGAAENLLAVPLSLAMSPVACLLILRRRERKVRKRA